MDIFLKIWPWLVPVLGAAGWFFIGGDVYQWRMRRKKTVWIVGAGYDMRFPKDSVTSLLVSKKYITPENPEDIVDV